MGRWRRVSSHAGRPAGQQGDGYGECPSTRPGSDGCGPCGRSGGNRGAVCPAWQTEKLAASLRAAGYDVKLVELDRANHFAPVFHDLRGGRWQVITEDPAGEQAVNTISAAITAARANAPAN
jgi:hypothetical protein